MKVHLLRTVGRKDADKYGIDKEKLGEFTEGAEVDVKKETAEKLIQDHLAVTPENVDKELFEATPPAPLRAVAENKDAKDKK